MGIFLRGDDACWRPPLDAPALEWFGSLALCDGPVDGPEFGISVATLPVLTTCSVTGVNLAVGISEVTSSVTDGDGHVMGTAGDLWPASFTPLRQWQGGRGSEWTLDLTGGWMQWLMSCPAHGAVTAGLIGMMTWALSVTSGLEGDMGTSCDFCCLCLM